MTVPESVRDDRDVRASVPLLFRQKSSPAGQRNSQYAEKIDGSARSVDGFRFALRHQTKCERIETRDALKSFVLLLDLRVFRIRQECSAGFRLEIHSGQVDD